MAWWRCKGCKGPPIEGNNYEKPWIGPCPHCGRSCNAEIVGENYMAKGKPAKITAASSANMPKVKRYKTGVEPLDFSLSGGVVKSQSLLIAGLPGCRKTTIVLQALDGLSKATDRPLLFVSAEQNDAGVLGICQMNNITNEQVIIHPNNQYHNSIEDVLQRCDEVKPFALGLDSLQPSAKLSGLTDEAAAKMLADYCQRTKMIAFIISQLTGTLSFKGGTGPSYYVDTLVMFEPFRPSVDGDPIDLFGRKIAKEVIGYNAQMRAMDSIDRLRVLVGGANGKNRHGDIDVRSYLYTTKAGEMLHLVPRQKTDDENDEEVEET